MQNLTPLNTIMQKNLKIIFTQRDHMRLKFIALTTLTTLTISGCVGRPSVNTIREQQITMDQGNAHLQRAIASQHPVYINSKYISPPNSAGGVSARYSLRNISAKPIKYITLSLIPYNAVGDIVKSSIGGKTLVLAEFTGPLATMEFTYPTWNNLWYNQTLRCVQLEGIEIIYMDGEIKKIEKSNIGEVFSQSLSNTCKV